MYDLQHIAKTVAALANETRLAILNSLLDSEKTVTDLVEQLELDQPRVSAHLAILSRTGLVFSEKSGRQRTYSVDRNHVVTIFRALQSQKEDQMSSAPSAQALQERRTNTPLRQARTCYDHLAGVAGVRLLDEMLRQNWLVPDETSPQSYRLTSKGEQALHDRGVDFTLPPISRRTFAKACDDWTERRPHLAGFLGASILHSLEQAGAVERDPSSRAMKLRPALFTWLNQNQES